jgi:hypothetical protein
VIEAEQVAWIAGDDWVSLLSGKEYHGGIDDVGGVGDAAEFATGTGELFIEWYDLHFLAPQEPCQRNLDAAIAPSLSHDACRDSNGPALRYRSLKQGNDALVAAIQGDQRTGIQYYPRRGASARSAHSISSADGSPNCSVRSRNRA